MEKAHSKKECIKIEIVNEGTFSLEKGENVLSVLTEQKLFEESHCGGHGTCGKCAIRFVTGAPLPKPGDRRRFSPQELRDGWRLACLAKPQTDCMAELGFAKKRAYILDKTIFLCKSKNSESAENAPMGAEKQHGPQDLRTVIVVDLGTTTLVAQLVEWRSGKILDTYKTLNPQRTYGADVVTRMERAMTGKGQELSDLVNSCLEEAAAGWKQRGYAPEHMVLAGNTVMVHLLMGYDVQSLAKAPFVPVTTKSCCFEVAGVRAVTVPGISAFVGGDIVAGMLVCDELMQQENIERALLIDLGTNGEMALLTPDQVLCTATAAGPAFEGGFGSCIYGSDVIAVAAQLLEKGIIDETGLLSEPYFTEGYCDGPVKLRREDIRSLQTAKAAVFAGIRILLEKAGIEAGDVQRVYLAGGFGYKLSVEAACRIGVIPSVWKDRTVAVGNAALAGAYLYAVKNSYDMGVISGANKRNSEKLRDCESINLAECENFNTYYLQAMELKEERDLS